MERSDKDRFLLRHPIAVGTAVILVLAAFRGVVLALDIVLLTFCAVLVAVLMGFPVRWLSRVLPRGVAVVLTLIGIVGFAAGATALSIPTISEQGGQFVRQLPRAIERAERWFNRARASTPLAQGANGQQLQNTVKQKSAGFLEQAISKVPAFFTQSASAVSGLVFVLILGAFFVYQPNVYRDDLRSLVPIRFEAQFDSLWEHLGNDLKRWLRGILISMTIMGSLTAAGLALIGLKEWPLLGLLTFFGTFVPYLGALASAVPGLLLGLADSASMFAYAALVYLGVHLVEGYLVEPLVMKRAVEIRPGLLLIWQATAMAVLGVTGIVVATPLLVCVKVITRDVYVRRVLGKGGQLRKAA